MGKFLKRIMLLGILFMLLFVAVGYYLEYQFQTDNSNKFTWIKNIQNCTYDYAFLGSSRTYNMIDINLIDSNFTTNGINLGVGGTDYRTLYMIFYSFVEIQKNQVDELFIQVDPFMFYNDSIYNKPINDHYFFSLSNNKVIYDCIKNKSLIRIYRLFPVVKYVEYNKVFNLTHFIRSFSKTSKLDETKGSVMIMNQLPFKPIQLDTTQIFRIYNEFCLEDQEYFDRILKLCAEKSINPILYTAPIFAYSDLYFPSHPNFEQIIELIAVRSEIPYFNFVELYQDSTTFFNDMIHLNQKGTVAFTKQIIEARTSKQYDNEKH